MLPAALNDRVDPSWYGYGGGPCEGETDLNIESRGILESRSRGTIRGHVETIIRVSGDEGPYRKPWR